VAQANRKSPALRELGLMSLTVIVWVEPFKRMTALAAALAPLVHAAKLLWP
jgi:hypothetical protein